jgi:hypothetical protein
LDARLIARILASGRIGLGVGLFAAPRTAARLWLGQDDPGASTLLARGLGARDIAIGVGQLVALDDGDPGPWIDAGVAADAGDTAAGILGRRHVSPRSSLGTVAVAGGSALLGLWLKRALDA